MKKTILYSIALLALNAACSSSKTETQATIKDAFKDDFLIGAAIPMTQVNGEDPKADSIVSLHYNTIVAENCMKSEVIQPEPGKFFFDDADAFVRYGEDRGMAIIGHCLVWHCQLAPWFPYNEKGEYVGKEEMKRRMKEHIQTLVGRYKGKIKGWDVVNECIEDDGSYRHMPFYDIIGEEFIPLAFEYAHEADPDAELYLNDYCMYKAPKRDRYVQIINDLKARGIRIDGMGMQSHIGFEDDDPDLDEYQKTIDALAATGVQVMVTELDISALPFVNQGANVEQVVDFDADYNPYVDGLTPEAEERWNKRASDVMALYRRNAGKIARVNWWGTHDGMSWRNDWPMHGRTDYPLPFGRDYKMKPFMQKELSNTL